MKQKAQECLPSTRLEGDAGRPRACGMLAPDRRSTLTQPNARILPSKIITRTNAYVTALACQARRDTAHPLLLGHSRLSLMWPGCTELCRQTRVLALCSSPGSATSSTGVREAPSPFWAEKLVREGKHSRNRPLHPPLGRVSLPATQGHRNQTDQRAPLHTTKHTVL